MILECYLAMTAAEFAACHSLPDKLAWMACHFSSYGTGLSNLPPPLPNGSMVILNDRTPIFGHDPALICQQLSQLQPAGVLLDLQRDDEQALASLAKALTQTLSCPVGVSSRYARALDCPVFLETLAPHCRLEQHLAPWKGREIWLEIAPEYWETIVTAQGTRWTYVSPFDIGEACHYDADTFCHYQIFHEQDSFRFRFARTENALKSLLEQAESLGVTKAFGLYQQLKRC